MDDWRHDGAGVRTLASHTDPADATTATHVCVSINDGVNDDAMEKLTALKEVFRRVSLAFSSEYCQKRASASLPASRVIYT